jgi:hypothetical protein
VDAVLVLPDGTSVRRLFDSARFIDAGIFHEDALFTYTVVRQDNEVTSRIDPSEGPTGVDLQVPDVDFSVFEPFQADKGRDDGSA